MKKIKNLVLASAAFALPVLAATLPFTESFDSGFGEFTHEDANNDDVTFKTNNYYGYNYSNGLQYAGSSTLAADDWLFTPVLSLKAGYVYELTFRYKVVSSNSTQRIEWKAGTAAESSAMTVDVDAAKEYTYNYGSWEKETLQVSVPADGNYHLGMHIISDAGMGAFYVDQIEIADGVNGAAPVAPVVNTPVFNVVDDALAASFEIKLPSTCATGAGLTATELVTTVTREGSDRAATVTGAPGATVTYTDPDAPLSAVTYTFTCADGELTSPAVEVRSNPNIGTPKSVETFNVEQNGNEFHLTWDAVTEATSESAIFIPSQVRYLVKCGDVTVADNIAGLEADHTVTMPETGQDAVSFSIIAVFGGRQSTTLKSASYMVGDPYAGEFHESFADRSYDNKTWSVENDENYKWQPSIGSSYSPVVNPQDNDGGCLEFSNNNMVDLHIWSPNLDLSSLSNPKLKFWVYLQPTAYYEPSIQPGFRTGGEDTLLGEPICLKSGEAEGWTEFTYDLPESALQQTTQLFFIGYGGTYGKIFIDNISIKSYLDHNLAVTTSAPARHLEIGDEVTFVANITNKGVNDETEYDVSLYADEELVTTVAGVEVSAMSEATVELPFKALPKYAGTELNFNITVNLATDADLEDNNVELMIPVNENELNCVQELTAVADNTAKTITLNWLTPDIETEPTFTETTESFEQWEAGTTEAENGWIFIDADGVEQAGLNNINQGQLFAAMVAENFAGQYSWDLSLTCQDGEKCLAITQAKTYYNTDSDNWVISPEVKGGSSIEFQSMTLASYGSAETFDLMWSEGGIEPEDFTVLSSTVSAPINSWTCHSFELPATARRFAIRVYGRHTNTIVFDSFTYTLMSEPAQLLGFNIYRDDALLCSVDADKESHIDESPVNAKEHTYHVTAVYNYGESMYSNEAKATMDVDAAIDNLIDDNSDAEYFSIDGLRIDRPAKGSIVITRKNGKTQKHIIN